MLLSVYALVALVSTTLATHTPSHELKQVVRRMKRGVRPRAPVPSGAGEASGTVTTTRTTPGTTPARYDRYFTGSGSILAATPSGESTELPSVYATYANTVTTASAAQQCIDLAQSQSLPYYGAALWFDESDNLWHCRTTYNRNDDRDFSAVDANARPVYGYNLNDN